jgi:hypothetical protein
MRDPRAFHIGPELKPVRGHRPEELGRVFSSGCVQPDRAVLLRHLRELVRDDELLRRSLRVLEDLVQRGQLLRVLPTRLRKLGVVGGVGDLDLGQRDLLGGVVGRADLLVPLKAMCSNMCASPLAPCGSSAEPASTSV